MDSIDIKQTGRPYPLGVTTDGSFTYFSVVMKKGNDCGIILYDKVTKKEKKLPFGRQHKYGSIYSMAVKGLDTERYSYNYYEDERIFTDPYAKKIHGREKWGRKATFLRGGFLNDDYDWENDRPLVLPLEESILYCLNVRAFTRHNSSNAEHKGTFHGIVEKIPYLKELGITGIELMPSYEFDEMENSEESASMEEARLTCTDTPKSEPRLNCWGYKEGFYFAPKTSFGSADDTVNEFKYMVKELHRNGIEIIMQFYFPKTVTQGIIPDVVKYWVLEYHIDGIHLKGERIPLSVIATEPLLSDTKIWYDDFSYEEIYGSGEPPAYRNLASYNDNYLNTARRFLKGDDNMLGSFLELQRRNPDYGGVINYVTNYYGFTLADMVSYEQKHNEANGESNRDGSDNNATWNCGTEGPSRRKSVISLRRKQMKNALTMLFLSQGTPLIYSGDEIGNTRYGNNNPYCQDNRTGWVKWTETAVSREIFSFTRSLISLRKSHPVLRNAQELRNLDYIGCGYPDLSYHGEDAWRPDLSGYSRFAGVMYSGCYAKKDRADDNFFYIAYNMHWLEHTFALPKLPKGMKWCLIADTNDNFRTVIPAETENGKASGEQRIAVQARSIQIYQSKQEAGQKPDKRLSYKKTSF